MEDWRQHAEELVLRVHNECGPRLRAYLLSRVMAAKQGVDFEDVYSRVLELVWRYGHSYDEKKGRLCAWASRIAENAVRNAHEAAQSMHSPLEGTRALEDLAVARSKTDTQDQELPEHTSEVVEALRAAMASLSLRDQKLLLLSACEGMTYPQIALELGASESQINSLRAQASRLRRMVKEFIEQWLDQQADTEDNADE